MTDSIATLQPTAGGVHCLSQRDVLRLTKLGLRRLRSHDRVLGVVVWAGRPAWPADRVAEFCTKLAAERALIARTMSGAEVAKASQCSRDHILKTCNPVATVVGRRGLEHRYCPSIIPQVIANLRAGRERRLAALHAGGDRYRASVAKPTTAPDSASLPATVTDTRTRGRKPRQRIKVSGDKATRVSEATERVKTRVVNQISKNRKNNP